MRNNQTSETVVNRNAGLLSSLSNESANVVFCITINGSTQIPLLIKQQYHIDSASSAFEDTSVSEKSSYLMSTLEKVQTKQDYEDRIVIEAKRFLDKLYSLHTSDAEILGYAFKIIESAFARHDLLFVDALLASFEPNRTKTIVSTGLLRATFRARTKLNSWKLCAAHVSEYLNDRGENTKHLLRGLIRANDSITITTTTLS